MYLWLHTPDRLDKQDAYTKLKGASMGENMSIVGVSKSATQQSPVQVLTALDTR